MISERFEALQDRYEETDTDPNRTAREEMKSAARELLPATVHHSALTIISAVVATAGHLLDSPSIVVVSMVIAPLVGPALAASVGTVIDDRELRVRGTILQVLGIFLAIGSATAFAYLVKVTPLVPPGIEILSIDQIRERLSPNFLALAIALGSGIAGALSLSTGVSAALVGVMIAVALIPPAAVVGIGIAWGLPSLTLGAAIHLSVNILSINMAALTVLWYQGYRPEAWFKERRVKATTLGRIGVLAAVILLLSTFLGGVTYASYQGAVAEETIREEARSIVADHEN